MTLTIPALFMGSLPCDSQRTGALHVVSHSALIKPRVLSVVVPIVRMKKLRLREVKQLARGPRARSWQGLDYSGHRPYLSHLGFLPPLSLDIIMSPPG